MSFSTEELEALAYWPNDSAVFKGLAEWATNAGRIMFNTSDLFDYTENGLSAEIRLTEVGKAEWQRRREARPKITVERSSLTGREVENMRRVHGLAPQGGRRA